MIIRVKASNFKSFENDVELCMLASRKEEALPHHTVRTRGASILRHAAIYGANAAGKTNAIDIFNMVARAVRSGAVPMAYRESYCKLNAANKERESSFEVQFVCDGHVFSYRFSCILFTQSVVDEALYELVEKSGDARLIFSRNSLGKISLGKELKFNPSEKKRLATYTGDFKGNSQSLFLHEINTNKKTTVGTDYHLFYLAYNFLSEKLVVLTPKRALISADLMSTRKTLNSITGILASFDTGISEIKWERMTQEQFTKSLRPERIEELKADVENKFKAGGKSVLILIRCSKGFILFKHSINSAMPTIKLLRIKHEDVPTLFRFNEESDGTRRLFDIVGVLLDKTPGRVFVIDELDRSLHPMLSKKFVELFGQFKAGTDSQLIFSTHEPSILDSALLRRDEIWFVERKNNCASELFPLDRFVKYEDRNVARDYLEGRYGAIPYIRELEL